MPSSTQSFSITMKRRRREVASRKRSSRTTTLYKLARGPTRAPTATPSLHPHTVLPAPTVDAPTCTTRLILKHRRLHMLMNDPSTGPSVHLPRLGINCSENGVTREEGGKPKRRRSNNRLQVILFTNYIVRLSKRLTLGHEVYNQCRHGISLFRELFDQRRFFRCGIGCKCIIFSVS